MNIKAVVFDLDDTLLRDDWTISDYTVSVLRRAAAEGILVIPASGRARTSMAGYVRRLGCASAYIAYNGAQVWSPADELLFSAEMPTETALEVARFANKNRCYAQTYVNDRFYYSMHGEMADAYARATKLEGEYVGDLERFITTPTSKILLMDTAERIAELLPMAREEFAGRLSVSCSKPYFLEFNPITATKGNALRFCAERFGFTLPETAAFGDSLNDMSMLTIAGQGIAMANAREDVRAALSITCGSNQQDGVARYIEKHILREELHK